MKNIIVCLISFFAVPLAVLGLEPGFDIPAGDVVAVDVPATTGLSKVYVLRDAAGVRMTVPSGAEVGEFGNSGAAYATPVKVENGAVTLPANDSGYTVYDGQQTVYFYVVNYANHMFRDGSLTEDGSLSDCSRVAFAFTGDASPINYYTINGRSQVLSRDMTLEYDALVYSEEGGQYVQQRIKESVPSVGSTFFVNASGCRTEYSFTPDRFASLWGIGQDVVSDYIEPRLVDATVKVEQTERRGDNEKNPEAALGGSAPVDISFSAAVTDASIFHEWQFSRFVEFDDIDRRFTDLNFEYSFTEAGTTYVRFVAADAAGVCDYVSETYEVFIGESKLECPNAFSPYGTPGVNDLWKVSYQSIVSFECHIFNRWGKQICSFTEPSQGWDGKFKGKLVPAGVYYYVIKAKGADGHNYNLSGDINLIKSKSSGTTDSGTE